MSTRRLYLESLLNEPSNKIAVQMLASSTELKPAKRREVEHQSQECLKIVSSYACRQRTNGIFQVDHIYEQNLEREAINVFAETNGI